MNFEFDADLDSDSDSDFAIPTITKKVRKKTKPLVLGKKKGKKRERFDDHIQIKDVWADTVFAEVMEKRRLKSTYVSSSSLQGCDVKVGDVVGICIFGVQEYNGFTPNIINNRLEYVSKLPNALVLIERPNAIAPPLELPTVNKSQWFGSPSATKSVNVSTNSSNSSTNVSKRPPSALTISSAFDEVQFNCFSANVPMIPFATLDEAAELSLSFIANVAKDYGKKIKPSVLTKGPKNRRFDVRGIPTSLDERMVDSLKTVPKVTGERALDLITGAGSLRDLSHASVDQICTLLRFNANDSTISSASASATTPGDSPSAAQVKRAKEIHGFFQAQI